ncbi:MAG TPA: succinate dehydrogenase cytochrome b subunit [Opitutaceae bacterium]|nr:succinate dehydrogenase cytochrome b subunit [Opitutaceae bacterium]
MDLVRNLFGSTIGKKLLMAATGVVLIGFVTGHLAGNLQVFEDPDRINGYSHFLQSLGPALWAVRIFLLLCVAVHIWAGTVLALEDRKARGGEPYAVKRWIQATVSSRYMRSTGFVVLAFILYHLAQFTVGVAQPGTFKENLPHYTMKGDYRVLGFAVVRSGTDVLDVRSMVILGFRKRAVALFYIVAVGLLSVHLLHGADSLFQTLGWRSSRWERGLNLVVTAFCAAYFLGNLAIPGAALLGILH